MRCPSEALTLLHRGLTSRPELRSPRLDRMSCQARHHPHHLPLRGFRSQALCAGRLETPKKGPAQVGAESPLMDLVLTAQLAATAYSVSLVISVGHSSGERVPSRTTGMGTVSTVSLPSRIVNGAMPRTLAEDEPAILGSVVIPTRMSFAITVTPLSGSALALHQVGQHHLQCLLAAHAHLA